MNKISKILVMAVVMLAVVTMSIYANASTQTLLDYVLGIHNINDMVFELTDSQKAAVKNYVSTLDDATADAVHADIVAAENVVRNSGARNVSQISAADKQQVINLATSAAKKAGLVLTVNTANNTFKLAKQDGSTLVSGSADSLIKYNTAPASNGGSAAPAQNNGAKLLYTGANYVVYGVAALAIVAVAVVVKKRA